MKAVILESYVMHPGDLDWSGVKALVPDTTQYVRTAYEEIVPRIQDAELVLLNKCRIDEAVLAQCPKLRWVGIIATGTDNLDLAACRRHGVSVANVPGYSTYSVAQMTFSLLLAICQCAQRYDTAVKDGHWQLNVPACYGLLPQQELYGKVFGVYGYGSIGRQAARIAQAFGMRVLACTRTQRPEYDADGVEFCSLPDSAGRKRRTQPPLSCHPGDPGPDRRQRPGSDEARRHPAEHRPRRTGGRSRRCGGPAQRASGFLWGRRFCCRAPAPGQPAAGGASCAADPPHCLDHSRSPGKPDAHHHPESASFLQGQGEHIVN